MALPDIQTSFGAGELSKNLYARVDLKQYNVGAALMRNFFTDYRGGASSRMGTQYIATCTSQGRPRLIPFQFSTTETYVLEFGNLYVNVYFSGSLVQTVVTPYAEADLPLLKYAQSADTLVLTHSAYPTQLLKRTAPNTFSLAPMVVTPKQSPPTSLVVTGDHASSTYWYGFVVTAMDDDGSEESLPTQPVWFGVDQIGRAFALKWTAPTSGGVPQQYRIYCTGAKSGIAAGVYMDSAFGLVGYSTGTSYTYDTASGSGNPVPDFSKQPPQFTDPFTPNQPTGITVNTGGSGFTPLTIPAVTMSNGGTAHAILAAGAVSSIVLDFPASGTSTVAFSGGTASVTGYTPVSGTYPSAVSFFQQRLCLAATPNEPQTIWCSQTGNVFNFDSSPIVVDSDSIKVTLASRQVNQIQSMISMPSGLICLTTGGAWLLSGGGNQLAMTPIDVAAQPQASSGASSLPPININNDILYVQARGSTVRDLVYNFYVQSFFGTDRSAFANHLFYGYQIQEWCYAEEPFRIIYAVRNDGQVLTFTYVPEQEVFAWSHMDTQGQYLSVCSIPEGNEDSVYFIVRRFVNGTWVNYIERLHSRQFYGNVEFPFCVDSGLSLAQSAPNATLTLSAASGTVNVIASSAVFAPSDTGAVLRGYNGGKGILTYQSTTSCSMEIVPDGNGSYSFPTIPDDDTVPAPLPPGSWIKAKPVTTVTGLNHLANKKVVALADGQCVFNLTVSSGGAITLPRPASYVMVGLAFTPQLQTLYIDLDGGPTIQGKRKLLPRATFRIEDTMGMKAGTTFDNLTEYVDPLSAPMTTPGPLISGDIIHPLGPDWTLYGQVCVQQDYPLPIQVLGIIPEVVVGDTGR